MVSLSPSLTEIITAYGQANLLVGRTASCNYPTFIGSTEVVMSGIKPDYERIAAKKPDLVLYDADILSESEMAKIKEMGIAIYGLKATNLDEFERSVLEIGALVGTETRSSEYVDKIQAARGQARARKMEPAPKVAIVLPGDGSEHMVSGTGTFFAEVVKECGGDVLGPESAKYEMLNAESLLSQDPDFVLVAGEPGLITQDPRFKSLRAFKNNKIIGVNADVALRKGARVDTLIKSLLTILR